MIHSVKNLKRIHCPCLFAQYIKLAQLYITMRLKNQTTFDRGAIYGGWLEPQIFEFSHVSIKPNIPGVLKSFWLRKLSIRYWNCCFADTGHVSFVISATNARWRIGLILGLNANIT